MSSLADGWIRIRSRTGLILGFSVAVLILLCSFFSKRVSAQGSEEIPFYKHTIDLEQSEAAAVAALEPTLGRFFFFAAAAGR